MSEPKTRAVGVLTPAPGLLHWSIHDERIDFRSEAYALQTPGGWIAIDPLPLDDRAIESLPGLVSICITGGFHQRAAWSLRRRLGVEVQAPRGAARLVEEPDRLFEDGQHIAPGLRALHRPGPSDPHHVLHASLADGRGVLFCGDLLIREGHTGPLRFASDEHQEQPGRSRRSVERLLELEFELLCPAHGAPCLERGRDACRAALASD